MPVGSVVDYCGATEPSGWLFGYGQQVSRSGATADLFGVYSVTFGIGNGSTTFNMPDFRGRIVAGRDNMGGTSASRLTSSYFGAAGTTVGATGGAENFQLLLAHLAAHAHGGATQSDGANSHTHTGTTNNQSASHHHDDVTGAPNQRHQHAMQFATATFPVGSGGGSALIGAGGSVTVTSQDDVVDHTHNVSTADQTSDHNHTFTSNSATTHTHTISSAGSDTPHRTVQPTIICNKIVKL